MVYYTRDLCGRIFYVKDKSVTNPNGPHNDLGFGDMPFYFSARSNALNALVGWNVRLHMCVEGREEPLW